MSDTKPLTERLEIKAMMIQMGERIAYGSDSGIMREAVAAIKNLQAERDALLDRVEKAEKDAERYRWLRDSEWEMFEDHWLCERHIYGEGPDELNAAIDAAMEASK